MIWYQARVFTQEEDRTDPDESNWVEARTSPGVGNPVTPWAGGIRSRVHAYDAPNNKCLVGVFAEIPLPDGWVKLGIGDAQAQFLGSKGRPPTAKEVF